MDDIAREAGVSKGLVSAALNRRETNIGVNEKTRQRILETAKRMNYRLNRVARSLVDGVTMTIGLIVPPLSVPIEARQTEEFSGVLERYKYLPLIVAVHERCTDDQPEPLLGGVKELVSRQVDGLIIYQTVPMPKAVVSYLNDCAIPHVYVKWYPPEATNVVKTSWENCDQELLIHLRELGHSSAQLVLREYDLLFPEMRLEPMRRAADKLNFEINYGTDWAIRKDWNRPEESFQLITARLKDRKAPTAMIFFDDLDAIAGMAAIQEAGMKIPDDISVVGQDDMIVSRMLRPSLTTRCYPDQRQIAEAAFKMLNARMNDPEAEGKTVRFDHQLVIRQSTGIARKS